MPGFIAEYYADLDYRDDGLADHHPEHAAFDRRVGGGAVRAVTEGVAPRR